LGKKALQGVYGQMTDTPTMRERLARALDEVVTDSVKQHPGLGMADMPYSLLVDALLAEMERPSEAMTQAMGDGYVLLGGLPGAFIAAIRAIRDGA
jgi:hypothetical protein